MDQKTPLLVFARVRDATGYEIISRLAGEIWREHYPPIIGTAQVEYMLKIWQSTEAIREQVEKQGFRYVRVEDGGADVGYISTADRDDALFLSKFYLRKECRGRGIAQEMMAYVEGSARRAGRKRVTLTTHKRNRIALRAYEKMGFRILEPVVTEIGDGYVMDDYRLEKNLD